MNETSAKPNLDVQDPLPESNWMWRRTFSFLATLIVFGLLIGLIVATHRLVNTTIDRIDTMQAEQVALIAKQALTVILEMFRLMFWALMVVVTYYMVAPSAEQITKILQTAGLLKAGVQIAGRTVETPERKEVVSTVGTPPQPAAPPVSSETAAEVAGNGARSDETDLPATGVAESLSNASTALPEDMPPISVQDKD